MNKHQCYLLEVLLDHLSGFDLDNTMETDWKWNGNPEGTDQLEFKEADNCSGWEVLSNDQIHTEIISFLNESGIKTERGLDWNKQRWRECRYAMAKGEDGKKISTRRDIQSILEKNQLTDTFNLYGGSETDLGYKQRDYDRFRYEQGGHSQSTDKKYAKIKNRGYSTTRWKHFGFTKGTKMTKKYISEATDPRI
jgi:hypothetical protein